MHSQFHNIVFQRGKRASEAKLHLESWESCHHNVHIFYERLWLHVCLRHEYDISSLSRLAGQQQPFLWYLVISKAMRISWLNWLDIIQWHSGEPIGCFLCTELLLFALLCLCVMYSAQPVELDEHWHTRTHINFRFFCFLFVYFLY